MRIFHLALLTADTLSPLAAIAQLLAVAGVSFVLLTLAFSHFRYQRLMREAASALREGGTYEDLRLCLVDALGRRIVPLLLIRTPGDTKALAETLRGHLRKGDQLLFPAPDALLLWLEPMDPGHLPRVALRLAPLLRQHADTGQVGCLHLPLQRPAGSRMGEATKALDALTHQSLPAAGWLLPPDPGPFDPVIPEEQRPLLDEVTGVLHADRVSSAVQKILAAHRRRESPVCLVLASVDDLNTYRESFGEAGARAVLRDAAEQWMRNCRESDLIGRLDEDTFVICMAGEPEPVLEAARRVGAVIRQSPAVCQGRDLHYTLSAAVVGYPRDAVGPGRLFQLARRTLDAARERGRGLVLRYDPSLPVSRTSPARRETPEAF